jgi:hypothetical protein
MNRSICLALSTKEAYRKLRTSACLLMSQNLPRSFCLEPRRCSLELVIALFRLLASLSHVEYPLSCLTCCVKDSLSIRNGLALKYGPDCPSSGRFTYQIFGSHPLKSNLSSSKHQAQIALCHSRNLNWLHAHTRQSRCVTQKMVCAQTCRLLTLL